MKKKYIFMPLTALMLLSACDYNDKNFEGLDESTQATDIKKSEYTLTDADYKTIAENKTNMAMAEAAGDGAALAAIKSKFYLSEKISAKEYLPAFISDRWYTASSGSSVKITYDRSVAAPAYLDEVQAAKTYKLTNSDYDLAWEDEPIDYFSPSKPASTYLPRILKNKVVDPAEGQYMVVEYNYSSTDPSAGGGGEVDPYNKISDAVEGANGEYNVKGTVAALYARGFLLTDGKASILVYQNVLPNVSLGDVVAVKGTTSVYSGLKQFANTPAPEITNLSMAESFEYPTFAGMSGADLDAYLSAPVVKPATITGTLVKSGTNYNVTNVEGATNAIASLSYPAVGVVNDALVDQRVTISGYTIGYSSNRVNFMLTSIAAANETAPTAAGIVALAAPGNYTVQGQVVATYARGFLVNDGTGTVLVYLNKVTDLKLGTTVRVSGAISRYNAASLNQFSAAATITVIAESAGTVKYPAPYEMSAIEMDAYPATSPAYAKYVSYKGRLAVSVSGTNTYYNVQIDGAATAQGSISFPNANAVDPALDGKEVVVTGYTIGSSSGKFVNTVITSIAEANTPAAMSAYTRASNTEKQNVVYQYKEGSWVAANNTAMVNPSNYRQMGIAENNFSSTNKPDNYLAQFMALSYPYAQNGTAKAAVYYYNDGKTTMLTANEYLFADGAWKKNTLIETVTDQFVFDGEKWNYDPSIVIRIFKNDPESKRFLQLVVDSVKVAHGDEYIDRGNTEYYYGCSAFYGNIELAPSYWKNIAPYKGKSDDEVNAIIKEHAQDKNGFFAYALRHDYPEMDKMEDIDVTVTINFDVHKASGAGVFTIKYLVTGKGQFEYIPDSYKEVE